MENPYEVHIFVEVGTVIENLFAAGIVEDEYNPISNLLKMYRSEYLNRTQMIHRFMESVKVALNDDGLFMEVDTEQRVIYIYGEEDKYANFLDLVQRLNEKEGFVAMQVRYYAPLAA